VNEMCSCLLIIIKKNLSLYSSYYSRAYNEFAVPISESSRQNNTAATCVDVEAVATADLQNSLRLTWALYCFSQKLLT